MPGLIFEHPGTLSVRALFAKISNGTPATSEILDASLLDLAKDHQIIIKDESGSITRRAGVHHDSDLIIIPRQKRLFFGQGYQ